MAEVEEEPNHWPGFVDALSTIVMVVTFLLIILAIAIFVTSLNVAKVAASYIPVERATNIDRSQTIQAAEDNAEYIQLGGVTPRFRSLDSLRLQFTGSTVTIDDESKNAMGQFLTEMLEEKQTIVLNAYFDPGRNYAQARRIAYYRLLAARNVLLSQGHAAENIEVYVREAPNQGYVDLIEFSRR